MNIEKEMKLTKSLILADREKHFPANTQIDFFEVATLVTDVRCWWF